MILQRIDKKLDLKYMITIDPTYHTIKYKEPINRLIKNYKHIIMDWYDKKYKHKQHLHKKEQHIQLICSHLYYIKSSKEMEYLKRNGFRTEIDEKYNPHLHILIDMPCKEITPFFMYLKKKIRMRYPYSKCDYKKLGHTDLDLINSITYGMKEETEIYTQFELQNGFI